MSFKIVLFNDTRFCIWINQCKIQHANILPLVNQLMVFFIIVVKTKHYFTALPYIFYQQLLFFITVKTKKYTRFSTFWLRSKCSICSDSFIHCECLTQHILLATPIRPFVTFLITVKTKIHFLWTRYPAYITGNPWLGFSSHSLLQ